MTEKRKSGGSRIPRFYIIYFSVTGVVLLAVLVALWIVRGILAEYEEAQPKYAAQEIFSKYFEPIDYTALLAEAEYEAGDAEAEQITEYLVSEIGDEELTYSIGSSNDPGQVKYIVKAGPKQIASIELVDSGNRTKHGFPLYEFSHLKLNLNTEAYLAELARFEVMVDVPAGYLVTVDGEALSGELITSEHEKADFMKYYPADLPAPKYELYTITTLRELPDKVTVTDPAGTEAEVTLDEDTRTYTCSPVYSDALREEYADFVTKALEKYAAYVQAAEDVGLNDLKKYFDTDSDAYADVVEAGTSRWMVYDWSGIEFENVNAGEFCQHTPEIFSCHISFTQRLHRAGREDYVDAVDMIVFLHSTENGYKIYDWFNAS